MEEWDLVGGALVRTEHRDWRRMVKTPDIFFEAATLLTAGAQSMCRLMVAEKPKWGDWDQTVECFAHSWKDQWGAIEGLKGGEGHDQIGVPVNLVGACRRMG